MADDYDAYGDPIADSRSVKGYMKQRGYDPMSGTHGTIMDPRIKGRVLPAQRAGVEPIYKSLSRTNRAYYTANLSYFPHEAENYGWFWARQAASYHRDQAGSSAPAPRPVVHFVKPSGEIKGDPVLNPRGASGQELTANSLKVTDTSWIPTPGGFNDVGVQGTLPHVNWNQFHRDWGLDNEDHNSVDLAEENKRIGFQRRMTETNAASDAHFYGPQQLRGQMSLPGMPQRQLGQTMGA